MHGVYIPVQVPTVSSDLTYKCPVCGNVMRPCIKVKGALSENIGINACPECHTVEVATINLYVLSNVRGKKTFIEKLEYYLREPDKN